MVVIENIRQKEVSGTLVEQFQSALEAKCHRGTFFEDEGHLADSPVAQQILAGTYSYPVDLDPAVGLLWQIHGRV